MYLSGSDKSPTGSVERVQKTAAVLEDIGALILTEVSKTKGILGKRTDSPRTCTKSILEASPLEVGGNEQANLTAFAELKIRYGHRYRC